MVDTELGSGEKGDRHRGRGKGEKGDRHRGRGKGAWVEGFGQTPSCTVESAVRARSRSGEGGTGGVSIRDSGGSCCWHGECGGWLEGEEGSEGGSGGAMVLFLGVCVLKVWLSSPNTESGDLSHLTIVLTAALSSDDRGDVLEKSGWREEGGEGWQESNVSAKVELWRLPW